MEVEHILTTEPAPDNEAPLSLEDREFDRIAFELWQRGSVPEPASPEEMDLEEVACHCSLL